jgi:hypothetical protein
MFHYVLARSYIFIVDICVLHLLSVLCRCIVIYMHFRAFMCISVQNEVNVHQREAQGKVGCSQAPKPELRKPSFKMTKGRNRSVFQETGRFDYPLQGSCSSSSLDRSVYNQTGRFSHQVQDSNNPLLEPVGFLINRPVYISSLPYILPGSSATWSV